MIIIIALALISTFTKSSLLIGNFYVLTFTVFFLWKNPKTRKPVSGLFLTAVVFITIYTAYFFEKASVYFSARDFKGSFFGRVDSALSMTHQDSFNLLIGSGMFHTGSDGFWLDSLYLVTIYEEGLIGMLLAGTTMVLIGAQAYKLIRHSDGFEYIVIPIAISLSVVLLNGFSFPTLFSWPNMMVFWLLAGMARALFELKYSNNQLNKQYSIEKDRFKG